VIILHAAPIKWGMISGHNSVILPLVTTQNDMEDIDAAIVTTARNAGKPLETGFPVFTREALLNCRNRINLPAPFNRPHLVVFHSTYIPVHARIARKLRKLAIPYLICPHGGMTHYARTYKRLKKTLGNLLFFNQMVDHAAALHCLTQGEAEASNAWDRPKFVLGNGTDLPPEEDLTSPGHSPGVRLVFIGRLHVEYKGLDMLLDACDMVRSTLCGANAQVHLYGPDEGGSRRRLAARISRLQLDELVTLHGPVTGRAKTAVFKQADVFLHPSRSEGHPVTVLEALAHGIPCLLTPNTNMAGPVVSAGAGWEVQPSVPSIAAGIESVLSTEKVTLQELGSKARQLAARQYGWQHVASRSVEAYRRYAA